MKTEQSKGAIVVTGASRGIGAAIAQELAAAGYPVLVNYRTGESDAQQVVESIRSGGGHAEKYQADVTDPKAVDSMVAFAKETWGALFGAVNNACPPINAMRFAEREWETVQYHLDVQLKGAFYICQAVLPYLVEQRGGVIVSIASIGTDQVPPPTAMAYTMSKSALIMMSRCLAGEYGSKGVRVNCVSPGLTETDLTASMADVTKRTIALQAPLQRLGKPVDIARAVAFLFSDGAEYITGETVRVAGGQVMR